jgi:hypothetical protein
MERSTTRCAIYIFGLLLGLIIFPCVAASQSSPANTMASGPRSISFSDQQCIDEAAAKYLIEAVNAVRTSDPWLTAIVTERSMSPEFISTPIPFECRPWQIGRSTYVAPVQIPTPPGGACCQFNHQHKVSCEFSEPLAQAYFAPGAIARARITDSANCRRTVAEGESIASNVSEIRQVLLRSEQARTSRPGSLPPQNADSLSQISR